MKKASILAFQFADNFGALLQIYALSKELEKHNLEVEIINYIPWKLEEMYAVNINLKESLKERGPLKTTSRQLRKFKNRKYFLEKRNNFNNFRNDYLNLTDQVYNNLNELKASNELKKYDYYFVGSDQVWNPKFFKNAEDAYFLNFVSDSKNKISYAASIAEKLEDKDKIIFEKYLDTFDFISIREESSFDDLNDLTTSKIHVTLDPTLLNKKDFWESMIENSNVNDTGYVLVYDLVTNPTTINLSNYLTHKMGLEAITFSDGKGYSNFRKSFSTYNPQDFIKLINNADYIITSSFHGAAFSVIFEKEFFTVPHPTRGSRMIDLLNKLSIPDRIVRDFSVESILNLDDKIDYDIVNSILLEDQNKSKNFIKKSIEALENE